VSSPNGGSKQSGLDKLKNDGWWLVQIGLQTLLGREVPPDSPLATEEELPDGSVVHHEGEEEEPEDLILCPCYELQRGANQDPKAGPLGAPVFSALPFMLMPSAPVCVPNPDLLVDVSQLDEGDRAMLLGLVKIGENQRDGIRAGRAGIQIVRA
jgi:hypothetical protein